MFGQVIYNKIDIAQKCVQDYTKKINSSINKNTYSNDIEDDTLYAICGLCLLFLCCFAFSGFLISVIATVIMNKKPTETETTE